MRAFSSGGAGSYPLFRACSGLRSAEAFLEAVSAGEDVDPIVFAEVIDVELAPLLAIAEQIAKGGPFALRRAIDLASMIVGSESDEHAAGDGAEAMTFGGEFQVR